MTTAKREPKTERNLHGYGAPPIPWEKVAEGKAVKVTGPAKASRIALAYQAQGWPATVLPGTASLTAEYSAPSAGSAPWDVYEVIPETVFAFGTGEIDGATRWQF